jgi:hypothetical protein
MTRLSLAAPLSVIVLAALAWVASAWLCYANWRRAPHRRTAAWLESLRFVLITLLAVTLFRPEFVKTLQRTETPEIAILADASDSMKTRDATLTNAIVSRRDWLDAQLARRFWKPLLAKARVSVEPFSPPSTNAAAINGTDLNLALDNTLHRYRNLKAVVLLTDGDWNSGQSPVAAATRYREQGIPVFAVPVGRETPLPDLILDSVSAPAYGLLGEDIAVSFKVVSHLAREVKTYVAITDSFGEAARKDITIPPQGEVEDAVLWSPRQSGNVTATVSLPVEPDEVIAANNQRSFQMAVRQDKLKVLVVDSLPRWEYRYLRNALARDPGVALSCLLWLPDLGAGGGTDYIQAFPDSKESLASYDVVFLGDVGIGQGEMTDQEAELLKGLVEQQGSGLVFVPGRRGRQSTLLNSPLKDLFPVELDPSKPAGLGSENESQLMLTSTGKHHWLTRFDADEDRNDELWKQLPGFFWSASVEKSRPGSEVLAVHGSLRNQWGRLPLLVTRRAGNGKVLFLGTDSAWRWRRGVEDKFHYRFWGQVVRWMAHQRHLSEKQGMRLSYSPETPQAGDTVYLQCTVLDQSGFPVDKGPVTGKIISPLGQTERLDFAQVEGGWGVFKSSFIAREPGAYKLDTASEPYARHLTTDLVVSRPEIEKEGQPVNAPILSEIAALTGGAVFAMSDLDKMASQISLLPNPKPIELRVRLWSNPWWGGSILLLLSVYWIGRKWAGMM